MIDMSTAGNTLGPVIYEFLEIQIQHITKFPWFQVGKLKKNPGHAKRG